MKVIIRMKMTEADVGRSHYFYNSAIGLRRNKLSSLLWDFNQTKGNKKWFTCLTLLSEIPGSFGP